MPTCLHCNRPFLNKDALHQHLVSSGNKHPFCEKCDRRFVSQVALESVNFHLFPLYVCSNISQHIAAKHPPTYDCDQCHKKFPSSFSLNDHYRGSPVHPNCVRCGRGFKDLMERDQVSLWHIPADIFKTDGMNFFSIGIPHIV